MKLLILKITLLSFVLISFGFTSVEYLENDNQNNIQNELFVQSESSNLEKCDNLLLISNSSINALLCDELTFTNNSYEKKNVYVYASDYTDTWLAASFGISSKASTSLDVSDAGYGVSFKVYVSGLYGKTEVWGYGCDYNL